MCAEYHPESTGDNRWYLPVGDVNVPVNITTQTKATYPEIRLHPFFDEEDQYYGYAHRRSAGEEEYGEDPNLEYRRSRTDLSLRKIRSHIDIFDKNLSGVTRIRDTLINRILSFRIAECRFIQELEGDAWVQDVEDENVYKNANFNSGSSIVSVYDNGDKLSKTEDVFAIDGSWMISDEGMTVNPLTSTSNLKMKELVTNGLVFSDGSTMFENGILNIKVVRSQPQKKETPHLHHWTIHTITDYKDTIQTDYNKTYKQVDIND